MNIHYTPEDAAQGKQIPCDAADLLDAIKPRLNGFGGSECRLILFGTKLKKTLAELEVCDGAGRAVTACFAKSYKPAVAAQTFEILSRLSGAGFCPPSRFTVTRPLAHLEDRHVLVVEKSPGVQFTKILFDRTGNVAEAAGDAAGWLAALHGSKVEAPNCAARMRSQVERFAGELAAALPSRAERLRAIQQHIATALDKGCQPVVPSHRDFHPDNIFLAPDGRVTLIDLDQFGLQEPAGDVAYCLAQMAIMSYLRTGTFANTAAAREHFLAAYLRNAPAVDAPRLALHFAFAFVKSLHYELCVFHTENKKIVAPWLEIAERSLSTREMALPEPPRSSAGRASSAAGQGG